ncbi:MAG: hypothetical protein V4502_12025 [Pseudomonadota bacterium]
MTQPRLLLIDDEPALAEFLASAAEESGFAPVIADSDEDWTMVRGTAQDIWSRSTLECRAWTGSS